MTLMKGLLHGVERRTRRGEPFDCRHLVPFGLDGKHQARAHGRPIEQDGAAAAHAVLAADVGSGQAEIVA
jgi:hypothetical protein